MYSIHSPQSLAIRPLLNLLLPSNCVLCKDRLSESNYCLCKGCNEALPQLINQCSGCGTPMLNGITSPDISCPECQRKPPPFARCIAALHYMSPVDRLITRIKSDPHAPELQEL
jgi:predicted amidophosphoribosyltransferase